MARVNNSTLKALEVLEMLAAAEDGLRLTDVAEGSGYPISTARRLLVSLIERGYVEQDAQTSRYHTGTKLLTLQAQGIRQRHLGRRAYPHLSRLRQQVDETVNLGVLSDTSIVYLETLAPDNSFSFYAPPGTRMPLHCTAMGKVFLANLPAAQQSATLAALDLRSFTPNSATTLADLHARLREVAERGYSVDEEEYAIGVRCLAGPIRDHRGTVVAGVSITAPASRLPRARDGKVASILRETCLSISRDLGYQPGPLDQPVPDAIDSDGPM